MKVRIDFSQPKESQDPESFFDAVEFDTGHAGTVDEWGLAVLDLVRTSNWSRSAILISALMQSGEVPSKQSFFVKENRDDIAILIEELKGLLDD